ncbi:MAG TPA: GNAT family N-acetyltransferase [Trebonia sp.]
MRIKQWDMSDPDVIRECHEVRQAAQRADDPDGPPLSERRLRVHLEGDRTGIPNEVWFTGGEASDNDAGDGEAGDGGPGGIRGWYLLHLPDKENLDHAFVEVVVHPEHRRRGIGTALLRHAAGRAREHGRSVLSGDALLESAGDAFATRTGAKPGIVEAIRVLDVGAVPPGLVSGLRADAAAKATGYSLVSWTGPVPEERLDGIARLMEAMNDAPWDYDDERWDAERVRTRINDRLVRTGASRYTVGAVSDETGELAAFSVLIVDPPHPDWGLQGDTGVLRHHRGHRLGMLVKTAMLEWLATAEPRLRRIATGNAASNNYMISINERLGFTVHGMARIHDLPVAAILGD